MSNENAVFQMSRVSAYLEIAFESLVACALLWLASYVVGDVKGFVLWLGVFAIYGAAGIFLCRAIMRLRYRHVLGIRYVVDMDGIAVEEDGAKSLLNWSEFAKAEYLSLTPAYRLWATGQSRPVVLIVVGGWPGGRLDRRNRLAESLLKHNLASCLKTRWLPW